MKHAVCILDGPYSLRQFRIAFFHAFDPLICAVIKKHICQNFISLIERYVHLLLKRCVNLLLKRCVHLLLKRCVCLLNGPTSALMTTVEAANVSHEIQTQDIDLPLSNPHSPSLLVQVNLLTQIKKEMDFYKGTNECSKVFKIFMFGLQ